MEKKLLFANIDDPKQPEIDTYISKGGYESFKKVIKEMKPEEVIEEVKKSGIRGRGGAGFPAGMKWSFVPKDSPKPKYLVCNGDESEPGTCKDRVLMEHDPHLVVEGMAIASYAIGAGHAFIYIRGEFDYPASQMRKAIDQAYQKGFLGKNIQGSGYDLEMIVHTGGGAYICGEETALLNSLEGKPGQTRIRPPFPAVEGLYACPTVVNNVETLSNMSLIIKNGGEWYSKIGTEKSTGTRIFCLSGHVKNPGNYELELGTPMSYLINDLGGGIVDGKKLKAIIPGGSSTPILTPDKIDTKLDFESVVEAGSMLGSGGVIVMHEDTDMVWVAKVLAHFYMHESCGECTPCRQGTKWLHDTITRIYNGHGKMEDIDILLDLCDNIEGKTICPLGDAAVIPIRSTINLFRNEYEHYINHKKPLVENKFMSFVNG
ncbi:MAG: NADH-quinone oxidoreductase subunit NuoF [candidate division Zixibacteria bacterium]|nr:NADH-quinone oxidoreductase subunit NuoF [candidate division Zixibacteria bacterium]